MVDIIAAPISTAPAPEKAQKQAPDASFDKMLAGQMSATPSPVEVKGDPPRKGAPPLTSHPPAELTLKAEPTGEVKPIEPNAQANEPDSPSEIAQKAAVSFSVAVGVVAGVAGAGTSASTQPVANPLPKSDPSPISQPLQPLNASVDQQSLTQDASAPIVSIQTVEPKVQAISGTQAVSEAPASLKPAPSAKASTTKDVEPPVASVTTNDVDSDDDGSSFENPNQGKHSDKHEGHAAQTPSATTQTKNDVQIKAEPTGQVSTAQRTLIMRQVADKIELLSAARPKGGVMIQLQPADLGSITLILHGDRSDLQAQVVSENDKVRTALQQAHPDLVQHLGQRGVTLTSMSVTTHNNTNSTSTSTDSGKSNQQQRQDSPAQSQPNSFSSFGSTAPLTSASASSRSLSGIDLSI